MTVWAFLSVLWKITSVRTEKTKMCVSWRRRKNSPDTVEETIFQCARGSWEPCPIQKTVLNVPFMCLEIWDQICLLIVSLLFCKWRYLHIGQRKAVRSTSCRKSNFSVAHWFRSVQTYNENYCIKTVMTYYPRKSIHWKNNMVMTGNLPDWKLDAQESVSG